jgi:hypothetical protein
MEYTEIVVESSEGLQKHIVIDREDGSSITFPADEGNPEYLKFLNELDQQV